MRNILENIFIVLFIIAVIRWRAEKWASMLPSYNYAAWIGRKLFSDEPNKKQ